MLDLSAEFNKGTLLFRVKGDLTVDTAYLLESKFNKIITKSECRYVLFNLNDIQIMDKEGIRVVKRCFTRILKSGGKFMICGMDELFKDDIENNYNLYSIKNEKESLEIANL